MLWGRMVKKTQFCPQGVLSLTDRHINHLLNSCDEIYELELKVVDFCFYFFILLTNKMKAVSLPALS